MASLWRLEYAWKLKICSFCKQFGHQDLFCTKVKKMWMRKKNTQSTCVIETEKHITATNVEVIIDEVPVSS